MNDDTQNRTPNIGTQVSAIFLALIVGGFVAIVTVLVFANLFQPYKEMMPVAFVCAAILGSVCGLGLRRSMFASHETDHDDELTYCLQLKHTKQRLFQPTAPNPMFYRLKLSNWRCQIRQLVANIATRVRSPPLIYVVEQTLREKFGLILIESRSKKLRWESARGALVY